MFPETDEAICSAGGPWRQVIGNGGICRDGRPCMPSESIDTRPPDLASRRDEAVAKLRDFIGSNYPALQRQISLVIQKKRPGHSTRGELAGLTAEALGGGKRPVRGRIAIQRRVSGTRDDPI